MIAKAGEALEQALALMKAPRSVRPGSGDRLPEGMLALLKIVAGEEQAGLDAQAETGLPLSAIREAAGFYIQQVMFAPGSDSYRVLGVDPDAPDERIRESYRWLARWLHPDRNPDAWEVVYADRVNHAWQHLRTTERRQRYDEARQIAGTAEGDVWVEPPPVAKSKAPMQYEVAHVPPTSSVLRWLPHAVFGGLGVAVVGLILLLTVVKWSEPSQRPTEVADPGAGVEVPPPELAPLPQPEQVAIAAAAVATTPAMPAPPADIEIAPVEPAPEPIPAATAEAPPKLVPAPILAAPAPRVREPVAPAPAPAPVAKAQAAKPPRSRLPVHVAAAAAEPVAAVETSAAAEASPVEGPAEASATNVAYGGEATPKVGLADANRLLSRFSRAYRDGNLQGMRALFAHQARGNRESVLAGYDRLFGSSSERSLQVRDVSWFTTGDTLTIIASFEASVTSSRGGPPRRTRGDIRLDLLREDAQWRIVRLQHDERPG